MTDCKVRLILLTNGEEIIGKVMYTTDSVISVDNALRVVHSQPDIKGNVDIGLIPLSLFSFKLDGEIGDSTELNKNLVLTTLLPNEQMLEEYRKRTSPIHLLIPTGIQTFIKG